MDFLTAMCYHLKVWNAEGIPLKNNEVYDVPQFLTGGFLMPCTGWTYIPTLVETQIGIFYLWQNLNNGVIKTN